MKIALLTMWLNEEFLAPHFLRHYDWVDELHVIIDSASVDRCEAIAREDPRVRIGRVHFPDGFDNQRRADLFNEFTESCDADWIIVVDSDELVFHPSYGDPRRRLALETADVVFARMWQTYAHHSERPLCLGEPPLFQRCHGDPNRTSGKNKLYIKPCIFRPRKGIQLSVGNHFFRAPKGTRISGKQFYGMHWAHADVEAAIKRQIENGRSRLSRADVERGLARHLWDVDEQSIRSLAVSFSDAPRLLRQRWVMRLTDSMNSLLNDDLRSMSRDRTVSDPDKWHDCRLLDVLDIWSQRRSILSKGRTALRNWCLGRRVD